MLKLNPKEFKWAPWFSTLLTWLTTWGPVIIIGLGLFGALSAGISSWIGPPWAIKAIQKALNQYRAEAFDGIVGDPEHDHRVTVYRHRWAFWIWPWRCWYKPWGKGRWPGSGWLVPVVRSGHATKKGIPVFLAPDDADNAEGVAGVIWNRGAFVVTDLPDLSGTPTEEMIKEYARKSFVSVEWVQRRLAQGKRCYRSIGGYRIEVNNEPWGVVVSDSIRENCIKTKGYVQVFQKLIPFFIGELMKRA